MPVNFCLASSTNEIDSVFKLRHLVFVEQGNILKENPEKRLYDRFDAFPSTVQMIAQQNGETIGAVRFSIDDVCGLPADGMFDYRPLLPYDAKVMHVGMFCVHQDFRGDKIAQGLILMASYYGISNSITHVVAPIHPPLAMLLRRIGFKKVGEVFYDNHIETDVIPLLLDVNELKDFFVDFVRANQLHDFIVDYQRWFYRAGETIVSAGDEGNEAFIIIEGEVEVNTPNEGRILATLGPGDLFGEYAILTEEKRSADVLAKTDVQVMAMSKALFIKHFVEDSENALILMRMLSKRHQAKALDSNAGIAEEAQVNAVVV